MYGCRHGFYKYSKDQTGKRMRHCDLCDKLVLDSEIERLRKEKAKQAKWNAGWENLNNW